MWRLLLLVSLSPIGAFAQDAPEADDQPGQTMDAAARAAFVAGQEAYAAGEFEDALRAFSSGYDLSERPAFLFNIGSCHERLYALEDALDFYERYLEAAPDAANRAEVERRVERIRERLSAAEVEPVAAPDPSRTPAWVAFAVGATGAITFAVAGGLALKSHNDLGDCRPTSTCGAGERDAGKRRALVADLGLGVSLAGGIAGIILWMVTNPESDDDATVRVRPRLDRSAAGLRLDGRF